MNVLDIQRALIARGYSIAADGDLGPKTKEAIRAFQLASGLTPDGAVGPKTEAALKAATAQPGPGATPSKGDASPINSKFDATSAKRLAGAHPLLQQLMNAARDRISFFVADSQRGRAAQEDAFRRGATKAHFGQSAHNWAPAVAVDLWPKASMTKADWQNRKPFLAVQDVIGWYVPGKPKSRGLALEMKIPVRFGGDWNMNGILTDEKLSDLPHYELHPWQEFAKRDCRLFGD